MIKNSRHRKLSAVLIGTAAQVVAAHTFAQAQVGDNASASTELETVVVTAAKFGAQELQDTSLAVSVVDGNLLEEQGLHNIKDIANYVPNVAVSRNVGGTILSIRGIGSTGGEPSVTTQVDGVYIASSIAFVDFFDVERVEVLRGPQGTLYGRNATGGTINVISRQPSAKPEGKVGLAYGNYNTLEGSAYASGPIGGDTLRASLALNYREHDAYFENIAPGGHDIGTGNNAGARLQLLWAPSSSIEATTRFDYAEVDQYIESYDHLLTHVPANPQLANSLVGSYRDVAIDGDQTLDTKTWGVSEEINWHINDAFTLTSLTAWREAESTAFNDNDATELNALYFRSTGDMRQLSQEFNLKFGGERLNAVAGLYYYDDESDPGSFVQIPPSAVTPANRAATRGAFPHLETRSYAVYAQGSYALLPNLRAILGARYTNEENTLDQNFIATSLNPATPGANLPGFPIVFPTSRKDDAVTPKFGLDFQLNDDALIYLSATQGFKSGGFNGQATAAATAGFAPEEIWSYELGAKTDWLDHRLRVNLTGFYYDYTDLQVRQLLGPGNSVIANAASATVKGVELELLVKPFPELQISAIASYLDAKYDSFPTAAIPGGFAPFVANQNCVAGVCTIDASGNFLSDAPEESGLLALDYTPRFGEYRFTAHVDYSLRSERFFDPSNTPLSRQAGYNLLNANVGFGTADGEGWKIELYGKNLTDVEYYQTVSGNGLVPGAIVGDPRTYGVRVTFGW
jgi:iron complex outermembrane receptor protein